MWKIEILKQVERDLKKAPQSIRNSFDAWKNIVEQNGPMGIQKINGYWDHALKGEWSGARSSSLNQQWRVIYVVEMESIKVLVIKITPHDYRRK